MSSTEEMKLVSQSDFFIYGCFFIGHFYRLEIREIIFYFLPSLSSRDNMHLEKLSQIIRSAEYRLNRQRLLTVVCVFVERESRNALIRKSCTHKRARG